MQIYKIFWIKVLYLAFAVFTCACDPSNKKIPQPRYVGRVTRTQDNYFWYKSSSDEDKTVWIANGQDTTVLKAQGHPPIITGDSVWLLDDGYSSSIILQDGKECTIAR